jgi:DNA-binding IclR family transcriptional regulator
VKKNATLATSTRRLAEVAGVPDSRTREELALMARLGYVVRLGQDLWTLPAYCLPAGTRPGVFRPA